VEKRELNVKTDMLRSIGNIRGVRSVSPEEEKKGYGGNDLQKKKAMRVVSR